MNSTVQLNSTGQLNSPEQAITAQSSIPLSFIENRGQADPQVRFMAVTPERTALFTAKEATIMLHGNASISAIRISVEGGNCTKISGEGLLPGRANFFIGNDSSSWIENVPTYKSVRYSEILPGVDLVFRDSNGTLKQEFTLQPQADLSLLAVNYSGARSIGLDDSGDLILSTPAGDLINAAPICYQEKNGSVIPINASYVINGSSAVSFFVQDYDASLPLVIDPALLYSTYLGGSGREIWGGIDIGPDGSIYVAGETSSPDFPVSEGAFQAEKSMNCDAYVVRLSPDGSSIIFSTFIGGTGGSDPGLGSDSAHGIVVGQDGSAYVTGGTSSFDFPTTSPIQGNYAGGWDSFLLKLRADGSALDFSTFFGDYADESANGIALAQDGSILIIGTTTDPRFPTMNPLSGELKGAQDAFVAKFAPLPMNGYALVYSTYLGGGINEEGWGIAAGPDGSAYAVGKTNSPDYPTANPVQPSLGGSFDAFLSKISPDGSALLFSTFLGGFENDAAGGVAVDADGNAYVVGETASPGFPTVAPLQREYRGGGDAFVSKVDPSASSLIYSTFLGGTGGDGASSVEVGPDGSAFVCGGASINFPLVSPVQDHEAGGGDAFVSRILPDGSALGFSTYLGGSAADHARDLAVDHDGSIWLFGPTMSEDFPTTSQALQSHNGGAEDAFVAKIESSNRKPGAPSRPAGRALVLQGEAEAYTTSASDEDGDPLKYVIDWGDGSTTGTEVVGSGEPAEASHSWHEPGIYSISAVAEDCWGARSAASEVLDVEVVDNRPPNAPGTPVGPASGFGSVVYSYKVSATDPDGEHLKYVIEWGDGTKDETELLPSGQEASIEHAWTAPGSFDVVAHSVDERGLSSPKSPPLTVKIEINRPPQTPSMPEGSYTVTKNKASSYKVSSIDPDGDKVKIIFDWGDGLFFETLLGKSGAKMSASHIWQASGHYDLRARAVDEHGAMSEWSKIVTSVNKPPAKPSVPSGPSKGIVGAELSFTTSSTDPEKDQVIFRVDYGDGAVLDTGFFNSGAKATLKHAWAAKGTYLVSVMAIDEEGAQSAWSSPKKVTIT